MTEARKPHSALAAPGLALLALLTIAAAAPSFADRGAQATRSGGADVKAPASSAPPSSSSSASSGPSRSATSSGPRTAVSTRQSTPAKRSRAPRGRRDHYRPYHHRGYHVGFGFYPWHGYWGRGYYYPYYWHWGVPYWGTPYWGHYPVPRAVRAEYDLGAFDLNVRPRKAEVYLNGQLIGRAGQFDGWPDYLWLQRGEYELIFYRPGYGTQRRVLTIVPGVVADVRLQLAVGEAVAPAELSAPPSRAPSGAMAEVEEAYRRQSREVTEAPPPAKASLDTRTPPGRLRLKVLPADASVYLDGRLLGSGEELSRLHAGLVVEAGSHLLEVVRPGYGTEKLEFAVDEGDELELEVLLEAG